MNNQRQKPISPLLSYHMLWSCLVTDAWMDLVQASGMMRKALTVYQTYVEMMNDDIRSVSRPSNLSASSS